MDAPTLTPRQEAVLQAALECFNAHGVEACAIATICARAQASVGSVYHHFGSKEGLAGALYCEGLRRFQAGYLGALQDAPTARAGITALVRYHLNWVAEHPQWARYLLRTRADALQPQAQAALNAANQVFFDAMGRWFAGQVRSGALRALPRTLYVALLVGPCQEWARQFLREPAGAAATEAAQPDALADTLADAVWRALAAPGAAPARKSTRTKASR